LAHTLASPYLSHKHKAKVATKMVFHTKLGTKTLILRIIGFAIIVIIGFDPTNAKVGDIVMGMIQVGFFIEVALWLRT
jgi:uncharacterized protein YpmS